MDDIKAAGIAIVVTYDYYSLTAGFSNVVEGDNYLGGSANFYSTEWFGSDYYNNTAPQLHLVDLSTMKVVGGNYAHDVPPAIDACNDL